MSSDAKKLYLIAEIIKIENESVLEVLELEINRGRLNIPECKSFKDFAGIWTEEEAGEMQRIIEEGCGQIIPDDWK